MSVWAYHRRMLMHSLTLSAVLGYKCRWHFCTTIYLGLLFTLLLLPSQLWCCLVTVSSPSQLLLELLWYTWAGLGWAVKRGLLPPSPRPFHPFWHGALLFLHSWSDKKRVGVLTFINAQWSLYTGRYTCLSGEKPVYLTKRYSLGCPRTGFTESQKLPKRSDTGCFACFISQTFGCPKYLKSAFTKHSQYRVYQQGHQGLYQLLPFPDTSELRCRGVEPRVLFCHQLKCCTGLNNSLSKQKGSW